MFKLLLFSFLILTIIAGFAVFGLILPDNEIVVENKKNQIDFSNNLKKQLRESKSENSKIIIFAIGDIMLNRGVEYMIKKEGKGDFKFPFLKIADYLKKSDILFGNLEGPISNQGKKVGSIYSFRFDPKAIKGLSYAGFNILSLANNHMFDYQRIALKDTMEILKKNGISYVGAGFTEEEAFSFKIKEVKKTKIGFFAYTDLGPKSWRAEGKNVGIARIDKNDMEKIKKDIKKAKQKVNVLIVSLHSGIEYSPKPSSFQIEFSKAAIEAGADLIIGHHPHVVQKVEKYKSGWIAYSLGNFIFDQKFSKDTMKSLLLEIIIKNGRIIEVNSKEIKISNFFQPSIDI